MSFCFRAIGVLVSAAAIVLGVAAVPAAAAPAADFIQVQCPDLDCDPGGSAGLITLQILATTPVTSLTAHIMSGADDVLDISDFALTSGVNGSNETGIWTVTSPVTQGQLAYGAYTVEVDASDSGGTTVTGVLSGNLSFWIFAKFTLSASSAVFDFGHPSVLLSGTLSYVLPDGTTEALAGQPVTLVENGGFPGSRHWSLTTGAGGTFSQSADPPPPISLGLSSDSYAAEATAPDLTFTGSLAVTVTLDQDQLTVTRQWAASPVNYGRTAALTGTVTYAGGTTPYRYLASPSCSCGQRRTAAVSRWPPRSPARTAATR